ncbi:MAG: hypothetical protein FJX52_02370 [Alphaproteobacteria bacterium]|nr:hypothetical protein [Alphaproteobacteria bacterium]
MTQTRQIHDFLKAGHSITPLEALRMFGCFRLGARIWELRQGGVKVDSRMIQVEGARVAQYWLAR